MIYPPNKFDIINIDSDKNFLIINNELLNESYEHYSLSNLLNINYHEINDMPLHHELRNLCNDRDRAISYTIDDSIYDN